MPLCLQVKLSILRSMNSVANLHLRRGRQMTNDPGYYADELNFSREEYERRLKTVQTHMDGAKLDVLIVSTCINIHYLTGYQNSGQDRFQCLLVPKDGEPHFVLRKLWFTAVAGLSWTKGGTPVDD